MSFTYSVTGEGPMDRMLLPIVDWVLEQHAAVAFNGRWADPSVFGDKAKDVSTRIGQAAHYYPCDILFVHRDSDKAGLDARWAEIVTCPNASIVKCSIVCIVPVRMTESWFLFDEMAIRRAAGNPAGSIDLQLPTAQKTQRIANPKEILETALVTASETSGRRKNEFESRLAEKKRLVAQHLVDYSPLRSHAAFTRFENALQGELIAKNWARAQG